MFKKLKQWLGSGTAAPSPDLWAKVEARLPFLAYLPSTAQPRLRTLVQDFLSEKKFYGARGLQLTDEIMLTIAVQACLLIFNFGLAAYRGWVGIVVYPGEFIVKQREMDEAGVVHEYGEPLLGEAWPDGPVLVAWFDEITPSSVNVALHEFAHKLDMENGDADGFPRLPQGMSRQKWAQTLSAAYKQLRGLADAGAETVLDACAAESPAEFFAVATEAFFGTPLRLRAAFPALYTQLVAYYGLDPAPGEARWHVSGADDC